MQIRVTRTTGNGHYLTVFGRYMDGGVASGFRHVEPTKYEPRLFLVKKSGRKVQIKQIPMRRKYINSGDVFIMDLGLKIYQFNGANCSKVGFLDQVAL